jgi:hypothetical protein
MSVTMVRSGYTKSRARPVLPEGRSNLHLTLAKLLDVFLGNDEEQRRKIAEDIREKVL